MYFESRAEAGKILAAKLSELYKNENCVVIALNDGAVQVGKPIAEALGCLITILLMEDIEVPGENVDFGGMSQDGGFTYNNELSSGEIEDYNSEYHGYLDQQKQQVFQDLNKLIGKDGILDSAMFRNRVVILVSDGIKTGMSVEIAANYLKSTKIEKLVIATPVSTVQASDKVHLLCDDTHILDIKPSFMGVNHYYANNDLLSHAETIAEIRAILK